MGVTGIKLRHYAIGGIGMFPWIVLIVFVGTTISNIHDAVNGDLETGRFHLVSMIVGGTLAIVILCYVSAVVRRHLKSMLAEEEPAANGDIVQ